ncbi:transmembrane gamma-carboxyglutamic acid protein 2 isoform X2 [Salminus brasiliensis]
MPGLAEICLCTLSLLHLALARYINNGDDVFIYEKSADSFLSRTLLYNSWDFELVTPGNLQRECYEEICSYEEAREVFDDDVLAQQFWKTYKHNGAKPSIRIDIPGLVSGISAAVIIAVIATVLGCYCYKNRSKSRQMGSVPVQMAADTRPAPELVPLAGIAAPGLPSYNEALNRSGAYDAPPPPYSGETPSAPPGAQTEE